jgi:hypothetical protein
VIVVVEFYFRFVRQVGGGANWQYSLLHSDSCILEIGHLAEMGRSVLRPYEE